MPKYSVPWITHSDGEVLKIAPQVSYFQSPLLEFAAEIIERMPREPVELGGETKNSLKVLNKLHPLINLHLLPVSKEQQKAH